MEISRLESEINNLRNNYLILKEQYDKTRKQREYTKALEGFRNLLTYRCIILNVRLTIIQCTNNIRLNKCQFHDKCKERAKVINELINY